MGSVRLTHNETTSQHYSLWFVVPLNTMQIDELTPTTQRRETGGGDDLYEIFVPILCIVQRQ
jgi:hypothetical protein